MKPETAIELRIEPRLLDRKRMAAALCLSETVLDDLCSLGCPHIRVPRRKKILFNPDRVVDWLEEHSEDQGDRDTRQRASERTDNALEQLKG